MSADDPFAEPDDTDRTVIRPNPGGRRPAPAPAAAAIPDPDMQTPAPAAQAQPAARNDKNAESNLTGMNPLNASASTLFSLISRIRNRAQHPDPEALRRSVVAEVRQFENRALQSGTDAQAVKVARYAICATLDDVVLNTPWGGSSQWAQQSMVATFHRETVGGDRFYDLLARLEKDAANNINVLEFLYMCLALGFEGRLRVEQGGKDKHAEIRMGLARIIRNQRGEVERDLSPHWTGVEIPHKMLSAWKPFWISVAAIAAILAMSFTGLSYALTTKAENIMGQLEALDPLGIPELERRAPPVVVVPTKDANAQFKRLAEFLKPEIDQKIISVLQDANTITIRIAGKGMFKSGSDALTSAFKAPLKRVAGALNTVAGPVIIAGHSDSSPINTARFKTNQALSLARADTVLKTILPDVANAERVRAEGRSDKEPIADNKTREGRSINRRIEIVLVREES